MMQLQRLIMEEKESEIKIEIKQVEKEKNINEQQREREEQEEIKQEQIRDRALLNIFTRKWSSQNSFVASESKPQAR